MKNLNQVENVLIENKKKNFFTEWVVPFFMALIAVLLLNQVVSFSRVSGESMYPTLLNGDKVVVFKLAYLNEEPQVGDIVVFHSNLDNNESLFFNKKDLIKRVIAVGGDHVVISGGEVFVNDIKLNEEYLSDDIYTVQDVDMIVPENHYFCMGDNRLNSLDSRYPQVGPVSINDFVGKVVFNT